MHYLALLLRLTSHNSQTVNRTTPKERSKHSKQTHTQTHCEIFDSGDEISFVATLCRTCVFWVIVEEQYTISNMQMHVCVVVHLTPIHDKNIRLSRMLLFANSKTHKQMTSVNQGYILNSYRANSCGSLTQQMSGYEQTTQRETHGHFWHGLHCQQCSKMFASHLLPTVSSSKVV